MDHYFLSLINGGGPLCTIQRLKAKYHEALSNFGFNFNLRRYTKVLDDKFGIIKGTMTTVHSYTGRGVDARHALLHCTSLAHHYEVA
jgi:hypothetical protein